MAERIQNGLDDFIVMKNHSAQTQGHITLHIKMRGGDMILAVFLIRNPITTDDPNGFQPTLSRLLSTSTFYPKMELTIPCCHGTPRNEVIQLGKRLIGDFLHRIFLSALPAHSHIGQYRYGAI